MGKYKSRFLAVVLSAAMLITPFTNVGVSKVEAASTSIPSYTMKPEVVAGITDFDPMVTDESGKLVLGMSTNKRNLILYDETTQTSKVLATTTANMTAAQISFDGSTVLYWTGASINYLKISTGFTKVLATNSTSNNGSMNGDGSLVGYAAGGKFNFYHPDTDSSESFTINGYGVYTAPSTYAPANANPILLNRAGDKAYLMTGSNISWPDSYEYDIASKTAARINNGVDTVLYHMLPNDTLVEHRKGGVGASTEFRIYDPSTKTESGNVNKGFEGTFMRTSQNGKFFQDTNGFVYSAGRTVGFGKFVNSFAITPDSSVAYTRDMKGNLVKLDLSEFINNPSTYLRPSSVEGVITTPTNNNIKIEWDYNFTAQDGFEIYRDGTLLAQINSQSTTSFVDNMIELNKSYNYEIYSVSKGQKSDPVVFDVDTPKTDSLALGNAVAHRGDYVYFANHTWRLMNDNYLIANSGEFPQMQYSPNSGSDRSFHTGITGNVGHYLNTTYFASLLPEERQTVVRTNFRVTTKDGIVLKTVPAFVGLPSLTEVQNNKDFSIADTWTITTETTNLTGSIMTGKGVAYSATSTNDIRPVITLNPRAIVTMGSGSISDPFFVDGVGVFVPVPTGFKVEKAETTTITTSWNQVSGASQYILKRDGKTVYTGNLTVFKDTGLELGKSYSYTVVAVDSMGNTSAEASLTANTLTTSLPSQDAPKNFRVVEATDNSIKVAWDAVVGAEGYSLKRGNTVVYSGPLTEHIDAGLPSDTEQEYTVVAQAGGSLSDPATVTGKTKPAKVPYPTGFTVTDVTYKQVSMKWDHVPGADYALLRDGQEVYRGSNLDFVDVTITPGTKVTYNLVAVVNGIESQAAVKVVTIPDEPKPGVPPTVAPALKVVRVAYDRVSLEWTPSAEATAYDLYRNDALVASGTLQAQVDIGVAPTSSYTYKVIAKNEFGQVESNVVTLTTPDVPQNIIIVPAPPKDGTVTMDFKVVYGADTYKVARNPEVTYEKNHDDSYHVTYYNTVTGETRDMGNTNEVNGFLNFTETGLDPSQDYHYSIKAFVKNPDGSLTEVGSEETTVTTPPTGGGTTDPGNGGGNTTDPGTGGGNTTDPGTGGSSNGGNSGGSGGSSNGGSTGGSGGSTGGSSSNGGNSSEGSTGTVVTEEKKEEKETEIISEVKKESNFTDVEGNFARKEIDELVTKGILKGYSDGSFKPNSKVTRAEFAIMLTRALGLKSLGDYKYQFKDFDIKAWYAPELTIALQHIVTKGFDKYTYRPNAFIPREQASVMVSNILRNFDKALVKNQVTFKDEKSIIGWATNDVKLAASLGIIKGYEDSTFKPKNEITRAEVAVMIYRLLEVL
ncbi:S-layer homology domain-containing protein [Paenibacillus alvei]|uniref:S-layer homology domain-containing protein n=1 Tax=Paenibacillus alvei TaxID=44250 RepID=A0ABT4GVA1_PAEAL|nr:S-layer homology domain-containing protein [Paenibacillus alvei]MCY9760620.1 S-layer homology domain-containing protein [Paenibacillus alvei]MCY9765234.1 S-layer homology domain-containing protein [Paenibacillus alvei]